MGQQQSVQIQSEINHGVKATSRSIPAAAMEPQNLNGQKTTKTSNNTSETISTKDYTLKTTISSISSEGHDVVDDYDSSTSYEEDFDESDFYSEDEEDEELEGKL